VYQAHHRRLGRTPRQPRRSAFNSGDVGLRNPITGIAGPRHHRPRRRTEYSNELAPFHSITSSARARREGGTSSPSIFGRPAHERGSIFAILTYSAQALVSLTSRAFSICELPGNGSLPRLARNVFVSSSTAI